MRCSPTLPAPDRPPSLGPLEWLRRRVVAAGPKGWALRAGGAVGLSVVSALPLFPLAMAASHLGRQPSALEYAVAIVFVAGHFAIVPAAWSWFCRAGSFKGRLLETLLGLAILAPPYLTSLLPGNGTQMTILLLATAPYLGPYLGSFLAATFRGAREAAPPPG